MRPIAAWLALDSDSIFAGVIERNPTVALNFGDPDALSGDQKARALRAYVGRYGRGGWRGLRVPVIQVRRFATPGLASLIRELWPTVENDEVRELLLDLVGAARISTCADLAAEVALSPSESTQVRISSLDALIELSDPHLQGVVHALEPEPADWPLEIARPALVRLFPDHISAASLVTILARLTDTRSSAGQLTYHLPERIAEMSNGLELDTLWSRASPRWSGKACPGHGSGRPTKAAGHSCYPPSRRPARGGSRLVLSRPASPRRSRSFCALATTSMKLTNT